MSGRAAKTSAMFNNGVTSVEVVDSDNDDNGTTVKSGINKYLAPSINKFQQFFTFSPATIPSTKKRYWHRRQSKPDTENEPYYDQDDEQDDYSDKQELNQKMDYGCGSKNHDLEEDEDDDDEFQDEVRKKMIRKQDKKDAELKKKSKCCD